MTDGRVAYSVCRHWGKGKTHISSRTGQDGSRFHHATPNSKQYKAYELFISRTFHKYIWSWLGNWNLTPRSLWERTTVRSSPIICCKLYLLLTSCTIRMMCLSELINQNLHIIVNYCLTFLVFMYCPLSSPTRASGVMTSDYVFLGSSLRGQFLGLTLPVLRSSAQVFGTMSLNWNLSALFLRDRSELGVSGRKTTHRSQVLFLLQYVKDITLSVRPLALDIELGHLTGVVFSGFSIVKLLFLFLFSWATLWKEVTRPCHYLRDGKQDDVLLSLCEEVLHKLFAILLLQGFASSPLFIYLFNCLFIAL